MKKHLLIIGIIFLFLISSIAPMTTGINAESSEVDVDPLRDYYGCYNLEEIPKDIRPILSEDEEIYNVPKIENIVNSLDSHEPLIGPPMNSPWPMFNYDIHHTGRSPYDTSHITRLEKWRHIHINQGNGGVTGGPIIDENGIIYYGDEDRYFYAIYPNGTRKWALELGGRFGNTPAIDENGIIYVGTIYAMPNYLYAIYSENGTMKWKYKTEHHIHSCPVIGDDGTIYFGDWNTWINALYPNGTLRWRFKTGDAVLSSPAIGDDGIIFCGSHDKNLYAIYPNNGTLKWKIKTGHWIRVSPCTDEKGMVYFVSLNNYLYAAYQNNGTIKWKKDVGAGTHPTIDKDGIIYAGWDRLYAIYSENGTVKWKYNPGNERFIGGGSPITSIDGTIYFGTKVEPNGGDIIALNNNGTEKWRKKICAGPVSEGESSLCIGGDGTVYIGSTQGGRGYLHAFGPIESNTPPSAPGISGPRQVGKGDMNYFKFRAVDPDINPIKLYIDWGDGNSGWINREYASNELVWVEHAWDTPGSVTIKAKVKDVMDEESDWGYFDVTVPRDKSTNNNLLLLMLLERFPLLWEVMLRLKIR